VGEGPFTAEYFGEKAEKLRKAGGEYGAATGRPRRVGGFDVVASRYGVRVQGATEIALTKLDVLSAFDTIKVCVAYDVDGERYTSVPEHQVRFEHAKPIYEELPGWKCDIRGIRNFDELPENCRKYVEFVEEQIGYPITMVSNGPGREDIIYRSK